MGIYLRSGSKNLGMWMQLVNIEGRRGCGICVNREAFENKQKPRVERELARHTTGSGQRKRPSSSI